jgi:hypothetical protein
MEFECPYSTPIGGCQQNYPCHASHEPDVAEPGAIFTMIGLHRGYLSGRTYRVYGRCRVPEES